MADFATGVRAYQLRAFFETNGGVKNPAVELTEDDETHAFHFRALSNVNDGEPSTKSIICSCPTGLSLSYLNIIPLEEKGRLNGVPIRLYNGHLTSFWNVIPHHVLSRFALLEQVQLKEDSFWAPYINSLPKTFDTIMYFSADDLKWLDGTNLSTFREIRFNLWRSEWHSAMKAFEERGVDASQYSWTSYIWAASVFTSRGFDSTLAFPDLVAEQFAVLFPFVDSLNHDSNAKVDWEMGEQAFTLSTYETLKVGEEIFNNYGRKGNEELLAGYGFALPQNPYDQVAVKLGALIPPIKDLILSNHHLEPNHQSPSLLDHDLSGDLYLRHPTACKLGTYANTHPNLVGIPPLLLKVALGIYLYTTDRPESFQYDLPQRKPGRHIIGAIRQLLQVLRMRFAKLSAGASADHDEPANQKQFYARIYREGQLDIVEANITALQDVLPRLADARSKVLAPGSVIGVSEAVAALQEEDAEAARAFAEGMGRVAQWPLGDADGRADWEDVGWVLWWAVVGCVVENKPGSRIHAWLRDLGRFYHLLSRDAFDGDGEVEANAPPAYGFVMEKIQELAQDIGGAWKECAKRKEVVYWAAKVVQFEAWPVFVREGDEDREGGWVMYIDEEEVLKDSESMAR